MGSDSAAVDENNTFLRSDGKIVKKGDFMFAFTGSFRLIDIIRFSFTPPKHPRGLETREYLCTVFIDMLRDCLKDKGHLQYKDGAEEIDSNVLIGYKKRVFLVDEDLQIGEPHDNYCAIGCAELIALGAMAALHKTRKKPRDKILEALQIASYFDGVIKPPFIIKRL